MNTIEKFHIYEETAKDNQINDRHTVQRNVIFETILKAILVTTGVSFKQYPNASTTRKERDEDDHQPSRRYLTRFVYKRCTDPSGTETTPTSHQVVSQHRHNYIHRLQPVFDYIFQNVQSDSPLYRCRPSATNTNYLPQTRKSSR